MTTFADLMSLLMCFFVLLLAFSEMDVLKFQQVSGSMKYAFGVQHQIEVMDIPKGTSIIALEFSPGKPDEAPIPILNQQTMETTQSSLEFVPGRSETMGGKAEKGGDAKEVKKKEESESKSKKMTVETAVQSQIQKQMKKLMIKLQKHIVDGAIEIETLGQEVIIRINEKGSFAAGSGYLQPQFRPAIQEIAETLNDIPGDITITGNTDDKHIHNELFNSNWDLSSRRSVAVAQEMLKVQGFDDSRLTLRAVAYNDPRVPNNSAENRAKNRRVEIAITQGKPLPAGPISIKDAAAELLPPEVSSSRAKPAQPTQ